ncbi:ethanolamine utilization protein EutH [Cellulosilyticum lentocellum]|uniref:Ethanolamine utilization protein EutH n=1 Tax=Cellulosilyticum lentocellum (strain ATCC 49066 / DSM 5427 / NCIMB 11756 / RHM5) TaxID=642492 RepID=F2JLC5_CELLD|nr:ethanolamine utilization protein EutH [Cellulosilyticum lentocellum]ADZ82213.1 Ethanolamine utilization protein EutH [Cellulosilyticum lentocellum DSM 5427]
MSLNEILMFIMGIGVIIGAVDSILGNKWGLGAKFEEGFMCLGPTALSMVGIICLSPFLAEVLKPVIIPTFHLLGADPAMFASILAIDMGGYPLAMALAENPQIGQFSGLIVSTMLGATIVFTIPVGLGLIPKQDHTYFAKGLLIGLVPIPFGSIIGGILMGLPIKVVIINSIPILLIALCLMLGLIFKQKQMVKGFSYFGKGIKMITTIGLGLAAFTYLTDIEVIPNMPSIMSCMETVSGICIVLLGSLPLMTLILNLLKKPFEKLGELLGLNASSIGGILFSCISVLPVFKLFPEMNERGKVVTTAFFVSGIAVFAAHLGYTADVAPDMLLPMIIAKLSSGFIAIILAVLMTKAEDNL